MKLDRTSMLYGTLILTGTSIVSQFLGFVYRILLSRLIGAEVMGLYQLIMPVFSVIMALTAVGLTVAVSNLSSQYHARGNRAAIAQVLRRCLAVFLLLFAAVAAVVVLLYDPISVYLLGDARTQLGLLLLLPCILLTGVENLHKHFFYGTGNIRPPAAVEPDAALASDAPALAASLLACGEQPASPAAPAAMAAVAPKPRNARRDSPRSLRDMVMSSSLFEVFSRHPSCDAGMTIRRSAWFAADPKG